MKRGKVALIGRPNVGKSTLLNALLGEKLAIVSDKPQTTRTTILGRKQTDEAEIIFIDNPGIHRPLHKLNKRMMNFVLSSLEIADLLCLLIDATQPFGQGDSFVLGMLARVNRPIFLLVNKVDIIRKDRILPLIDKYRALLPFKEIIPISAQQKINLDRLEQKIIEYLPEAEPGMEKEQKPRLPLRFHVSEIIREKLLKRVEDELPFVTAVYVDRIQDQLTGKRLEQVDLDQLKEEKLEVFVLGGRGRNEKEVTEPEGKEKERPAEKEGEGKKREGARRESYKPGLKAARQGDETKKEKRRSLAGIVLINATIFVEKENQVGIVVGHRAQRLKEIGIEARRELEALLQARVYLNLSVKVKPRWRDKPDVLDLIEAQKGA